jgi:hemerythrin-like domain-containing protein
LFEHFIAEHVELRRILDRMPPLLADPHERNEDAIRQCRWEMSRLLFQHLSREEREIYSPLEAVTEPAMQRLATSFRSDLQNLHESFHAHMQKWATLDVMRNWSSYASDVLTLNDRLKDRFDREERILFPQIRPKHLAVTGTVQKNWARDVWSFRDQIMS